MADIETSLKRLVAELGRERIKTLKTLERIDADLADAQRMLARRDDGATAARSTTRADGKASAPGEAQREALRLMADREVWTPARLGAARGTSAQAAGVLLKRLAEQGLIEPQGGSSEYVISSLLTSEQESLPVDGSDDTNDA